MNDIFKHCRLVITLSENASFEISDMDSEFLNKKEILERDAYKYT